MLNYLNSEILYYDRFGHKYESGTIIDLSKNRVTILLDSGNQKVLGFPKAFEIGVIKFVNDDFNHQISDKIDEMRQDKLVALTKEIEDWYESRKPVAAFPFPEDAIVFGKVNKEYGYMSNYYGASKNSKDPYKYAVTYNGLTYRNAEAAFQAQKTLCLSERLAFTNMSGSEAKEAGRKLDLRPDWDDVKVDIMSEIVYAKFSQNSCLGNKLLSTGNLEIIENTTGWHDNFWGNCNCDHKKCLETAGENHLGKIIMHVRNRLREAQPETDIISSDSSDSKIRVA